MNTWSVPIEEIDELFVPWHSHSNASALFRGALTDEMAVRDVSRAALRDCFERAQERGYTFDKIAAETNRIADLEAIVAADAAHTAPTAQTDR